MSSTDDKTTDASILQVKRAIHCPRCGYDQRGIVATWTDTCPLEGVCSECGLTIVWSEVMQPEKYEPRWCMEFVAHPRNVPWACVKTYFRSFLPWRFWSRMKMSFPIRRYRLVMYSLLWIVPLLFLYVSLQTATAVYVRYQSQQELNDEQAILPAYIADLEEWFSPTYPELIEQIKGMSPEHYEAIKRTTRNQIDAIKKQIENPPDVDHSYFECIIEAVFLPLATESWGQSISYGMNYPYTAPDSLYELSQHYLFQKTGIAPNYFWVATTLSHSKALMFSSLSVFLLPVAMILLPMSRKRAKVRWAHIWRVMVYSGFIPITILWLIGLIVVFGTFIDSFQDTAEWITLQLMRYGTWVMLIFWWTFAIGRYLKIPHGLWITIVFSVVIFLVLCASIGFISPNTVDDIFAHLGFVSDLLFDTM